jgi:Protein of unknown function (DUF4232)
VTSVNQTTCQSGQLRIVAGKSGAAAGTIGQTILITNVSKSLCTITGYPRVTAVNADGKVVVTARPKLDGMVGGIQSGTTIPVVTLDPGQVASAEVEGGDVPTGSATSCPTYPAFLVTLPGEADSTQITAGAAGSNLPGFQGCEAITVNPVVPGTTGSSS